MSSALMQALHHQSALVFSIYSAQSVPTFNKVLALSSHLKAKALHLTKEINHFNIGSINKNACLKSRTDQFCVMGVV